MSSKKKFKDSSQPFRSEKPGTQISSDSPWKYLEWAALAWACFIAYMYLQKNPIHPQVLESILPTRIVFPTLEASIFYVKSILIWAGLMSGCLALGFSVLSRIRSVAWHSALERFVLSLAAGYGFASLIMLLLAGMHWIYTEVVLILWVGGLAWFGVVFVKNGSAKDFLKEALSQIREFLFGSENPIFLRIFLWIFLAISFLMALVPDLFYDAAVYHLGVPNLYKAEHGVVRIGGALSKVPMIWQIFWIYGLALSDEIIPKLLHWSCGLLILLGLRSLAGRFNIPKAGMAAGLFFLAVPMVTMNLWTAGVDVGGCLVALLAVYSALALANETNFQSGWVVIAAIFAAFAFGSKYQGGMIGITVFLIFTLYFLRREEKVVPDFLRAGLMFALVSFILIVPWLIKNIWDTGNPLFPFLTPLFDKLGMQKYHMDPGQWSHFIAENRRFITQSWREWWKLPWLLTFKDGNLSSLSFTGPIFLALLPLCLLPLQKIRENWVQAALLFLAVFFTFSFGSTHLTRYHLQGYPILCFWYGAAFAFVWVERNWPAKIVLCAVLPVFFLQSLQQGIFIIQNSYVPWDVLAGRESREAYRMYTHSGLNPYPSNAMYRWMEKNLPAGSRTLLLGESKAFDLKLPHVYTDVHGENPLTAWVRESNTAAELFEKFKAARVTHLFVNFTEAHRTYGYKMIKWDDRTLKIYDDFWKKNVRFVRQETIPEKWVKQESSLVLFQVMPEEEAAQKGPPGMNILALLDEMNRK